MTEDQLEQEVLGWLADVGWRHRHGPDLAPEGATPERRDYRQVLLLGRLRSAIAALNPDVPGAAHDDALAQVTDLGTPVLLAANRQFHRLLVGGVPVQYECDRQLRGDYVRLVDWAVPANNDWLAVTQFSITGPRHTRRPDIVLFVNGLPLAVIELKNPADPNADVWKRSSSCRPTRRRSPTSSRPTSCSSSPTAARRCSARCRPTPSASWRGARSTAWRSTRSAPSTSCRHWCAACWRRPCCSSTCAPSCCSRTTAPRWSRRSPATTSSTPCEPPSAR